MTALKSRRTASSRYAKTCLTLLAVGSALTTCGCWKTNSQSSNAIYAPSKITLPGGKTVTTKEGSFTPAEDVVFYRSDYVQELQIKLYGE